MSGGEAAITGLWTVRGTIAGALYPGAVGSSTGGGGTGTVTLNGTQTIDGPQ
jgi:hypothetical protein